MESKTESNAESKTNNTKNAIIILRQFMFANVETIIKLPTSYTITSRVDENKQENCIYDLDNMFKNALGTKYQIKHSCNSMFAGLMTTNITPSEKDDVCSMNELHEFFRSCEIHIVITSSSSSNNADVYFFCRNDYQQITDIISNSSLDVTNATKINPETLAKFASRLTKYKCVRVTLNRCGEHIDDYLENENGVTKYDLCEISGNFGMNWPMMLMRNRHLMQYIRYIQKDIFYNYVNIHDGMLSNVKLHASALGLDAQFNKYETANIEMYSQIAAFCGSLVKKRSQYLKN